jgi:hypothetical protein
MHRKYAIELTEEERQHLEKLTSSGTLPARTLTRAHILLKSDTKGAQWGYAQICEAFHVSSMTVRNVRKSFAENGLQATLYRRKPRREYARCLDGAAEAHLIALACSEPPPGRAKWSLRLLRDRFVQLGHVDRVSHETIRTVLKKTN